MVLTISLILAGLICLLPLAARLTGAPVLSRGAEYLAALARTVVNGAFFFSALCGLFIALVQLTSLVLRNLFAVNFIWLQESALYLFGTMFLLAGGAILLADGHVRVDVFYSRWPRRRQALVDLLGLYIFVLPICGLIVFSAAPYVATSWANLEGSSEPSGIDAVFLLKSLIPAFGVILALGAYVRIWEICTGRERHGEGGHAG